MEKNQYKKILVGSYIAFAIVLYIMVSIIVYYVDRADVLEDMFAEKNNFNIECVNMLIYMSEETENHEFMASYVATVDRKFVNFDSKVSKHFDEMDRLLNKIS